MIKKTLTALFGSRNQRVLKRMWKVVAKINEWEEQVAAFTNAEFPRRTEALKQRAIAEENLEGLIPEAFALVREAGKRVLDMRHFDVQLIGGMVLDEGNIAEMRTGEGKTLVATLAAYLNALSGKGVHVVTVNDYLAKRDAEWMGCLYEFLGLTTGIVVSGLDPGKRREAYAADITYGTNNEFGFDYLRDNMAFGKEERVQRGHHFAIVDEVDSILIDEARTPLIISGAVDDRSDLYLRLNSIIPKLLEQKEDDGLGDYTLDEKSKQAYLTEEGNENVEQLLRKGEIIEPDQGLYEPANLAVLHHLNVALRAHTMFHKDVEYLVRDNEILIVDEFTGRTMPGRRWADGLHQAIEAKEGVPIQNENQTLAAITYQNYFRLYDKLSGMTGTADTEAFEFQQIYDLEVIIIPTHKDMIRIDAPDMIFLKAQDKFKAILKDIHDCHQHGQPVLVGTASIEVSEYISNLLKKESIQHQVLNAKFHEKEAEIVAQAGQPGLVTIATNMAGRGTDIVLGGNFDAELRALNVTDEAVLKKARQEWQERHDRVIKSGGLHIIGTERHESRRIDNQLRGRSGRQGDPGSSRFYISLEDNLMRIFASEWVSNIMGKLGMEDGEPIESGLVSRAIENAQRRVEAHNFDIRKHLLEFDDVANDQRKAIYEQRDELLESEDISENISMIRQDVIDNIINEYIPLDSMEEMWNVENLSIAFDKEFGLHMDISEWLRADPHMDEYKLRKRVWEEVDKAVAEKEKILPPELMRRLEKQIMLDVQDRFWKEHLVSMDMLRQGIHLRSYAAKNPKQEYKREAFELFVEMLEGIKQEVIGILFKIQIRDPESVERIEHRQPKPQQMQFNHPAVAHEKIDEKKSEHTPYKRGQRKIGRNEPCPCGSKKKYKQCHGKLT